MKAFSLLLATLCLTLAVSQQSRAAQAVQPGPHYKDGELISAMLVRGAGNFENLNGRWASSLQELEAGGFLTYKIPEGSHLTYRLEGETALITSDGYAVYNGNNPLPPTEECLTKHLGTSKVVSTQELSALATRLPGGDKLKNSGPEEQRVYFFYGAQWLEEGKDHQLVADAMRFERIRVHYAFANMDFEGTYARMPRDVSELDTFIGLERNPAAWQSVEFVSKYSELDARTGNFFVGWDGPDFVVAANNGIKIEESRFTLKPNGRYTGAAWLQY